jgi:deazaflavin-dependent oxidoreductase (nitroreductase family)
VPFDASLAGETYCYLSTTGRRTGDPHTVEIWFGMPEDGRAIYVLSGGGDRSDWVRNLLTNPLVSVQIGSRSAAELAAGARVVEDGEESENARKLLAGKYQGWEEGQILSTWARTSLCVAIEPSAERSS